MKDYSNQEQQDELARQRQKLIGAFTACDEYIGEIARAGNQPGAPDPSLAERLAIRLLVKRFGWIHNGPGSIIRPNTSASSGRVNRHQPAAAATAAGQASAPTMPTDDTTPPQNEHEQPAQ